MTSLLAILWDSYRLLTAKKLFWVTLVLNILIALFYASIGYYEAGVSFCFGLLTWEHDLFNSASGLEKYLYMKLFTDLMVPWWLGFLAIIIALISVTPIFPSFLERGAIDIALSKPVGRVRLFLAKYLGSLLFVAIQVTVFCLICYLGQGIQIQEWGGQLWWALPLMILSFSSLYCIAVLISVLTRSTIFSLLMAFLLWGITGIFYSFENYAYNFAHDPAAAIVKQEAGAQEAADQEYAIAKTLMVPLPKIMYFTQILQNKMRISGEGVDDYVDSWIRLMGLGESASEFEISARNRYSLSYLIGTTLLFNLGMLSVACLVFTRKDY